jgi:hypothetical protein
MVDDIRQELPKLPDDKNKNITDDNSSSKEPAFVPPNLAVQEDGFALIKDKAPKIPHKTFFHKLHFDFTKASPKQRVLMAVAGLILLTGGGGGIYALGKQLSKSPQAPASTIPIPVTKEEEPAKPTTEASKLTGVQIAPELNKRPVISIQIENSPDARPQAGLKDAGVVFEAIAEGGITRFNASFLEAQPDYIGPVRSVRPYYAALAAPFDPVFVHAGGSPEGLNKLRELGLKDMDHGANGSTFKRVSDRYAPHNLYTSMADLDKASAGRGYTTSNAKGFARKAEKTGQAVAAGKIDLSISGPLYNVHYDYDAASNSYKRVMAGKPHTDHRSGVQIAPKVVVALAMSYSQSGIYSVYQINGEGTGFIFQDGQVQQVTWKKAGDKEQFTFAGADGKAVELNAGQTWITLLKAPNQATYTP